MNIGPANKKITVAIPVYKPNDVYLRETLRSVVNSGVDLDLIEIIVVNDCSGDRVAIEVVSGFNQKVKYYENERSLGISLNWNRCIELAEGEWIHILHQDDLVLKGFYNRLLEVDEKNSISVFASRFFCIDDIGNIISVSSLEQKTDGYLSDASLRIIRTNFIQCPSIAVKKHVYAKVGTFNSDLRYVLDWEMWFRISLAFSIWYVTAPLASFRLHSQSETPRIKKRGESALDMLNGISLILGYAPEYGFLAGEYGANHLVGTAIEFLLCRNWKDSAYQLIYAPVCRKKILMEWRYWRCWIWLTRIVMKNVLVKLRIARGYA